MKIELGRFYIITKGPNEGRHGVVMSKLGTSYTLHSIDGRTVLVGARDIKPYTEEED